MTHLKSPLRLPQLEARAKLLRIRAQDVLPSGSCILQTIKWEDDVAQPKLFVTYEVEKTQGEILPCLALEVPKDLPGCY